MAPCRTSGTTQIGTFRTTRSAPPDRQTNGPRGFNILRCNARALKQTNREASEMIALSIVLTWLALGAAAFLTLSAMGRVAARHDFEAQLSGLGAGESPQQRTSGASPLMYSAAHLVRAHAGRSANAGAAHASSWQLISRPGEDRAELLGSRSTL
jgi:hypothetical protein